MRQSLRMARFRFGVFEFDVSQKELRRSGVSVRLQAQPAEVLVCLLERASEVVPREELQRKVWKDSTIVDFERGLNFCIAQIRSALDDDAVSPRFIRTVPKRGYQFIAPIEQVADSASEAICPPAPWRFHVAPWRFAASATGVLLLVLVVLGIGGTFAIRHTKQLPIVAIARFDNQTGDAGMNNFTDGLTDTLIADLTNSGGGRCLVIGNASILRLPREQRDLRAVAASLGASYVVLGEVQANGNNKTRVLAHLIHLPEQTHVWVARLDRDIDDRLAIESQLSRTIADQFLPRIAAGSTKPFLFSPTH